MLPWKPTTKQRLDTIVSFENDECISSRLPAGTLQDLTTCISHHVSICPPSRTYWTCSQYIIDHRLSSLELKKRWSFLISSASPASVWQRTKVNKKEIGMNYWVQRGTNESFMCCSSAHLTLSNYLASAFNGGLSKWDKSAFTWEILKDTFGSERQVDRASADEPSETRELARTIKQIHVYYPRTQTSASFERSHAVNGFIVHPEWNKWWSRMCNNVK